MAKQYTFAFSHFPVTYTPYGYTCEMSLMAPKPTVQKTCTFAEAVAYLPTYGAEQSGTVPSGTVHAYIRLLGRDRAPAGMNDDKKTSWYTPREQAKLVEDAAGNIVSTAKVAA
jgi:hypothetical protein